MTGKPGRSGGPRPGAGPKVTTITLRNNDLVRMIVPLPQGFKSGIVTVTSKSGLFVHFDDGTEILLLKDQE